MPAERFFSTAFFENQGEITLEDQEFHHLAHVMRAKEKDRVELVNGQGQLAFATIKTIGKKRAALTIESVVSEPSPFFQIILAQAIPRGSRLDFILEKGTELGMTELWLFPGKLGERQALTEKHLERMRLLTISAMKQCGRLYLPKISLHPPLSNWNSSLPFPSFFGDVNPDAPVFKEKPEKGVIFFIGPESGFHTSEINYLQSVGALGLKLHTNILRTDTAALAALTLVSQ